jgi:hypothetical protein
MLHCLGWRTLDIVRTLQFEQIKMKNSLMNGGFIDLLAYRDLVI